MESHEQWLCMMCLRVCITEGVRGLAFPRKIPLIPILSAWSKDKDSRPELLASGNWLESWPCVNGSLFHPAPKGDDEVPHKAHEVSNCRKILLYSWAEYDADARMVGRRLEAALSVCINHLKSQSCDDTRMGKLDAREKKALTSQNGVLMFCLNLGWGRIA